MQDPSKSATLMGIVSGLGTAAASLSGALALTAGIAPGKSAAVAGVAMLPTVGLLFAMRGGGDPDEEPGDEQAGHQAPGGQQARADGHGATEQQQQQQRPAGGQTPAPERDERQPADQSDPTHADAGGNPTPAGGTAYECTECERIHVELDDALGCCGASADPAGNGGEAA